MTRLYDEMPKGALSERGVMWGREQNGQPGEAHYWAQMVAARGSTQLRAHFDPSYDPSRVDGLGDLGRHRRGGGGRRGGWHGGGPVIIDASPVIVEREVLCPPGQRLYRDGTGTPYCAPAPALASSTLADHYRSLVELNGLGDDERSNTPFTGPLIQKTFMSHRDFVPTAPSLLPRTRQHFEQGLVRPERQARGLEVLAEGEASARTARGQTGRLRAEVRDQRKIPLEVNALGELEPRMGIWGHEQSDRQAPWVSPPGTRTLPGGGRVVPTQETRIQGVHLSGLGDLAGKKSQKLLKFATDQNKAIQAAVAKGDTQAAVTAAAVTPWQHSGTGVTEQQVAGKLATPLGYQDIAAKIARAMGDTSVRLPTTIPVALPSAQQAAQLAPGVPTTRIQTAQQAPQQLQNVVAPGMPSAPMQISLPGAPPAPGSSALGPVSYGGGGAPFSGGGGGGGGGGSYDAAQAQDAAPAPAGPLGFLTKPISIPVVGNVPTWGVLAAAGAAYLVWRKRRQRGAQSEKARSSAPATNPKKKGKKR